MNKDIMNRLGFHKEVEAVENGFCPLCGDLVNTNDFRDGLSKKEFEISGICQKCQDDVFGEDD